MKVVTKYIPEIPNPVMMGAKWFGPGEMVDTEEQAKEIERLAGRDIIFNRVSQRAVEMTQAIEAAIGRSPASTADALIDEMIKVVSDG